MSRKLTAVDSAITNHLIECNAAFYSFCAAASAVHSNANLDNIREMKIKRARLLELLLTTEKCY